MKYQDLIKRTVVLIILINSTISFSQGGWNMIYTPINSINNSFINKEVRLDFRGSSNDTLKGKVNVFDIRNLLSKQDTISLNIKGHSFRFIEHWKIYVDHGVLSEQSLFSIRKNKQIIKEIFIESINKSTLTLKIKIYTKEKCKNNISLEELNIVVNKSIIKGVLTKY